MNRPSAASHQPCPRTHAQDQDQLPDRTRPNPAVVLGVGEVAAIGNEKVARDGPLQGEFDLRARKNEHPLSREPVSDQFRLDHPRLFPCYASLPRIGCQVSAEPKYSFHRSGVNRIVIVRASGRRM